MGGRRTFSREVAILEQRTRLRLDISNGSKLFDESSERVERGDWPSLDARDEETVGVLVGSVDKVSRSLLRSYHPIIVSERRTI